MIGIICGSGSYPKLVAKACEKRGLDFCLLLLDGFGDFSDLKEFEKIPSLKVQFGEVQKSLDFLRANLVDKVVFAGGVKRPKFNELSLDKKAKIWLLKLGKAIVKGDDYLLREVAKLFNIEGFQVVAGTDLLQDVFLKDGVYSKVVPSEKDLSDIKLGFSQARKIGAKDVGQAVAVCDGDVVLEEDESGTDKLIEKASENSEINSGCILVKASKPQQDLRLDLPTIGVQTIEKLHEYGFKGLAIEANKCIVIDKENIIKLIDEYGMFLVVQSLENTSRKIKIFISAGEASGDYLGGMLMNNINEIVSENTVEFYGIGGMNMCSAGLKQLFDINELSIIGVWEVVNKIFHVKKLINKTVDAILQYNPDVVVTIDSSGFNHRVDKLLKKKGFKNPIVHYVAPPVWAWRKWRVKTLHKFIDKLMVLLPFEKDIFQKHSVKTVFVGHPIATDKDFDVPDETRLQNFRKAHKIHENKDLVITILPGSRKSELKYHMPVLKEFVHLINETYENAKIIIPTLPTFGERIQKETEDWDIKPIVVTTKSEKVLGYYTSNLAIAASGTVTLELARVGVPSIVMYKISEVTYRIVKFLIQIAHVSLVNIIEEKTVVPELLQHDCTPQKLFEKAVLLLDQNVANKQREYYADVMKQLQVDKHAGAIEVLKAAMKQ